MKILFITRKYPPTIGGMETFSMGFVTALGDSVHLVAMRGSQLNLIWWLPYIFLKALFLARTVHVIHLGDGVLAGLGVLLRRCTRKPVTITVHGLDLTYQRFGYRRYIHWALPKLDRIISVSAATATVVHDQFKLKSPIILHGVDINQWPMNTQLGKNKCVLFVGRLVERKGCAWFIEQVLPQLPDAHLHIVGDGKELNRCQQLVQQLHLTERVRFHGQVSAKELAGHYGAAQALIMPNIVVPGDMEGFGLVALEAAACGLPVVAADLEGIRSVVIDGSTGILVKSGQIQAWIQAIQRVFSTPFAPEQIRQQIAQRFSWQAVGKQYLEQFKQLTDR